MAVLRTLLLACLTCTACAVQVTMLDTWKVVMLFQPVRLRCQFSTAATSGTEPIVTWKYKSFCRDRIADAFNPSSSAQQINSQVEIISVSEQTVCMNVCPTVCPKHSLMCPQMHQADPNYNVYTDCPDSSREVRNIATKQGTSVTLGAEYQARRITIVDQATLSLERAGWGDSGVYYCQVISVKDLAGNNEGFAEVLVLDWLFVVLVALAGIILIILLSICWCQCCPHTCPCYVRCPCCPERCCCPRALYEAGKAATGSYVGSHAPTIFTPIPGMYPYNANPAISDMDGGSSVGNSSRAPLLPFDDGSNSTGRNTYLQHDASGPRVLYVTERELSNMRPPSVPSYRNEFDRMTELSSLHEGRSRERERDRADSSLHMALREARERALPPLSDLSEGESDEEWQRSRHGEMRARSMEVLDDWGRERRRGEDRSRGRGRRSPSPSASNDYYYPSVRKGKARMKDFESDSRNGRLPPKSSAMSRSYESALNEPQRSPRSHPNSRTPPTPGAPPSYRSDDVDSRSGSGQGKRKRKGLQGRESLRV
uniref:Immunoglobulin-like domain containing receptor 2 n=1 Tax=Eptatretus burgeri TaxID=7764 RepID=A0A8C4QXG2_EPTBU